VCCSVGVRSCGYDRSLPWVFTNAPQREMKIPIAAAYVFLRQKRRRRWGARESVASSRPVEPDASRYPAGARIESSFACLESRHRAPLVAEEELGMHEGAGDDAPLARVHAERDAAVPPPQPGMGSATASRPACIRDSAHEYVSCRPYPGRQGRAQRARLPAGSYVRLGIRRNRLRSYRRARSVFVNVPSTLWGDGRCGLWLTTEVSHAARSQRL
jgi:hypothetical protein